MDGADIYTCLKKMGGVGVAKGVFLSMKKDELLVPMDIGLFCSTTVAFEDNLFSKNIQ